MNFSKTREAPKKRLSSFIIFHFKIQYLFTLDYNGAVYLVPFYRAAEGLGHRSGGNQRSVIDNHGRKL